MELNEIFYQHYWWFLISTLGALLVFLLFVQGGQTLLSTLAKEPIERSILVNSLGRKWEFTFTTLVVFGGAFFASFPLFYSTSFGGAYWLWMAILFSFIIQAVSYEYRSKKGNFLGQNVYDVFLLINGIGVTFCWELHCFFWLACRRCFILSTISIAKRFIHGHVVSCFTMRFRSLYFFFFLWLLLFVPTGISSIPYRAKYRCAHISIFIT